jgi:hypothetical protein
LKRVSVVNSYEITVPRTKYVMREGLADASNLDPPAAPPEALKKSESKNHKN